MLKKKLEALLFSSGRKMSVEELSRLADARTGDIQQSLEELKKEYESKNSSVMIVNEGDSWKLTVHEQFLPLVQKIITETELSKTIVETLAVIAFKYPIKQSDLIRIRTNKAYDHLKELEEMGYISRQKHGRTNLIKLTQKFFEYFNLPEEKLKEQFQDFESIANAIKEKESEIEAIKQDQREKAEEEKQKDEKIKEEIDLLDSEGKETALETYENTEAKENNSEDSEQAPEVVVEKEQLGNLEIVNEPSEEQLEKERERIEEIKEEEKEPAEEQTEKPKFEGKSIEIDEETKKIIDEKVNKIMHPESEKDEEDNKPEEKSDKDNDKNKDEPENNPKEPKDLLEASMEENESDEKKEE